MDLRQYRQHLPPKCVDNLDTLPDYMRAGMARYIAFGVLPGSFTCGILMCDLRMACQSADITNRYRIWDYFSYLYNYAPVHCWGTEEKVMAWAERGGIRGKEPTA